MDNKEKQTTQINAEKIIQKMLKDKNKEIKLTEMEIRGILQAARTIFLEQPILLQLQAPIKVAGDIHGQYTDLIRIFEAGGYPHEANYLFLGDYVDRGKQSIEVMVLLLAYKLQYPENFFMLRGNHQSAQINKLYGFYDECKRKYSIKLWKMFIDVFNVMPVCALIQQKIICMHGGLSPDMTNLKKITSINRPTDIPTSGILCDLLWSDPAQQVRGWNQNSERGISYLFGSDVLTNFLKTNDLDLVCRSHQIVEQGYEFFGKRQLVTVFSACNYCGMFDNWGALMSVDADLICSFHIIKPEIKAKNNSSGSKKRPKTPKYIN